MTYNRDVPGPGSHGKFGNSQALAALKDGQNAEIIYDRHRLLGGRHEQYVDKIDDRHILIAGKDKQYAIMIYERGVDQYLVDMNYI